MSALRKPITLQSDVTEASIFDGAGTEMTICCSEQRCTDAMTGMPPARIFVVLTLLAPML